MTMTATAALVPGLAMPTLRLVKSEAPAQATRGAASWWERRATLRPIVGGCPDHWWKSTAPRTAACTCDRF